MAEFMLTPFDEPLVGGRSLFDDRGVSSATAGRDETDHPGACEDSRMLRRLNELGLSLRS